MSRPGRGGTKASRPLIAVSLILGDFIMGSLWNLYGIFAETSTSTIQDPIASTRTSSRRYRGFG